MQSAGLILSSHINRNDLRETGLEGKREREREKKGAVIG